MGADHAILVANKDSKASNPYAIDLVLADIVVSRPVVDREWLGRESQIGSSGQTVSPRLYFSCGISGAVQHIVEMKNSECIVAINIDPTSPIFNIAT